MRNGKMSHWIAAGALGVLMTAGATAQTVPLRQRNPDAANRPNRPAPVQLTKQAQDAVNKAAADLKKLPAEQRLAAARELQRQIMDSLTPEERAKLMPQMRGGMRGGPGGEGGPGAWGGRRGRRGGPNGPGGPGGPGGPPPPGGPGQPGGPPPPPPPPPAE